MPFFVFEKESMNPLKSGFVKIAIGLLALSQSYLCYNNTTPDFNHVSIGVTAIKTFIAGIVEILGYNTSVILFLFIGLFFCIWGLYDTRRALM